MSHREKSLTPWIKPGSVVNNGTVRDEFKTVLPPSVYDAAVAKGCDMSWFIRQEPIPIMRPGKHRDSVSCHNCMPGLGGRCTCCPDQE